MIAVSRIAWFGHASGNRADGLSTYSREHVLALRDRGLEIRFFAHSRDGERTPVNDAVLLGSRRFKTVTMSAPRTSRVIAAELEAFQPDVVHLSLSFSLLDAWIIAEARRRGVPSVVTVHLPYAAPQSARGRVLRGLYRFHAGGLLGADRIVALSEEQAALLRSIGCSGDRVTVLPNSVDTELFSPGPSDLRRRIGGRFVVVYAGRLDPEKRVPALVEAFRSLAWSDDHALVIAGTGVQERQLRWVTREDPRVHLLGLVPDRAACVDVLRAADVFVLPSTAEGLSLSLLEAMATGCAVISTAVGDHATAIGDAGVLVPVRPLHPALSEALRLLHDDSRLRERLRAAARRRAVTAFSMRAHVDELLRLYADLGAGVAAVA